MRIVTALLFAFLLVTACKNNDKKDIPKAGKTPANDRDSSYHDDDDDRVNMDKEKTDTSTYTWTRKEQNKFLADCKRESGQKPTDEKLKDFCHCMLTQSQKYYSTYHQMDEKSNEDSDRKILANCAEYLDEDSTDQ